MHYVPLPNRQEYFICTRSVGLGFMVSFARAITKELCLDRKDIIIDLKTFLSRQINREDRVGGEGRKELRSLPQPSTLSYRLIISVPGPVHVLVKSQCFLWGPRTLLPQRNNSDLTRTCPSSNFPFLCSIRLWGRKRSFAPSFHPQPYTTCEREVEIYLER